MAMLNDSEVRFLRMYVSMLIILNNDSLKI